MRRRPAAEFDPKAFLMTLRTGRSSATYRRKQVIFAQGDPADAVFYVEKGHVNLTVVSVRGKSAIVATLGPGDFLGEGCLTGQPLRTATAMAMTETSAVRIDRRAMIGLLHEKSSPFSQLFLTFLLARNVRIEEDLVDRLKPGRAQVDCRGRPVLHG